MSKYFTWQQKSGFTLGISVPNTTCKKHYFHNIRFFPNLLDVKQAILI